MAGIANWKQFDEISNKGILSASFKLVFPKCVIVLMPTGVSDFRIEFLT